MNRALFSDVIYRLRHTVWSWIILVFLVALVVGNSYFFILDKILRVPFFINQGQMVGNTGLEIFRFQPIFLRTYDYKGGVFMQVAYWSGWRVGLADLWLSGNWGDRVLDPVKFIDGNKKIIKVTKASDLSGKIRIGSRLRVEYLNGEIVSGPTLNSDTGECSMVPRICQVYEAALSIKTKLKTFSVTGNLPNDYRIPVLYVGNVLERK
jgi:hypothetical protein